MSKPDRSGIELACLEYVSLTYRASDFFQVRAPQFWWFAALVVISPYIAFEAVSGIFSRTTGALGLPPGYLHFLVLAALLADSIGRLRIVAQQKSFLRLKQVIGDAEDYRAARIALLSRLFGVGPTEFLDKGFLVLKIEQYRRDSRAHDPGFWVGLAHSVFDPSSKPRVLALFAILVATTVALLRLGEGVQELTMGLLAGWKQLFPFVLFLAFILWIVLLMAQAAGRFLLKAASRLDARASALNHLHVAARDLIGLSSLSTGAPSIHANPETTGTGSDTNPTLIASTVAPTKNQA